MKIKTSESHILLFFSLFFFVIFISGCVNQKNDSGVNDTAGKTIAKEIADEKSDEAMAGDAAFNSTQNMSSSPVLDYYWEMKPGRKEGSEIRIELFFKNTGNADLNDVKIKFDFYTSSGNYYSNRKYDLGNVFPGTNVKKVLEFPGQKLGTETWSDVKMFISYNNESFKEEKIKGWTDLLKKGDRITKQ